MKRKDRDPSAAGGEDGMDLSGFADFLGSRGYGEDSVGSALESVSGLDGYLRAGGRRIRDATERDIREYFLHLVDTGANSLRGIVDLARYFYYCGRHEPYIYILSTLNGREVLESISRKLSDEMGTGCRDRVFEGLEVPPPGSPPEAHVRNTGTMVRRLLNEGGDTCRRILADDHHGIPGESFRKAVELYSECDSIDQFLARYHEMNVMELREHADSGKPWYEQEITKEVVELVRCNREMLSAVRKGDYLYLTKIPYAPAEWLSEEDPVRKRYLYCHCPLARESILMEDEDIPGDWCYCSGGFQKRMFDVLFNEFTEVELLESVLAGDDRCRFRIRLP